MKIDTATFLPQDILEARKPEQVTAYEDNRGNLHRTEGDAIKANLEEVECQLRRKVAERLRDLDVSELVDTLKDVDIFGEIRAWVLLRMEIENFSQSSLRPDMDLLAEGVKDTLKSLHAKGLTTVHLIDNRIVQVHPDGRHEDLGPLDG